MALFSLFHQNYPLYTTFSHPEVYVAGKKKVKRVTKVITITHYEIKEAIQLVSLRSLIDY
ncbi:hypothetical protein BZG82_00990 [Salinivibrio sp. PR5]|nr:hypothetical protein BZG82_00990 [Salinivibrio sp. PR5]